MKKVKQFYQNHRLVFLIITSLIFCAGAYLVYNLGFFRILTPIPEDSFLIQNGMQWLGVAMLIFFVIFTGVLSQIIFESFVSNPNVLDLLGVLTSALFLAAVLDLIIIIIRFVRRKEKIELKK